MSSNTLFFLEGICYKHAEILVRKICEIYGLSEEQKEFLEEIIMRPNDYSITVLPPQTEKIE